METTQRTNTAAPSNKITVPFYAPPPYKTSAEIISEARASIIRDNEEIRIESTRMAASIRPVNTKRPFTPRERERTLFGTARKSSYRPPSSFSLGYLQFQETEGGSPLSTTPPHVRRLNPIPSTPSAGSLNATSSLVDLKDWKALLSTNLDSSTTDLINKGRVLSAQPFGSFLSADQISKFRLPSIDSAGKLTRRHQFRATASLDNLPEEIEVDDSESEDSIVNTSSMREPPPTRKAYSSPVQRTRSMDPEMEPSIVKKKLLSAVNEKHLSVNVNNSSETNLQLKSGTLKLGPSSKINSEDIEKSGTDRGIDSIEQKILMSEGRKNKEKTRTEKIQKENSTEKDQKLLKSNKALQPTVDLVSPIDIKLDVTKASKSKKKNLQESKKNKSSMDKENVMQEQLEENAFGPELKVTDSKKKLKPTIRKENELQSKEQKSSSMEEKPMLKTEKHKSRKEHNSSTINVISGPESKIIMQNNKEEKIKKEINSKQQLSKQTTSPVQDVIFETKTKRSLQQTKQSLETSEKDANARKKPKSDAIDKDVMKEENKDSVQYILSTLNSLATKAEENSEEIMAHMRKLYTALEHEGGIGKNIQNTKLRTQVLKTLYKFVESPNETLLLQIARIILAFRVSGNNLSGVCKLVFKVSRSDKNDRLFLEGNILELFVEALGSASPLEDAESCVYGYGALKFLTMNNVLLAKVLKLGILELMVLHMKMVNAARIEGSRIPEQTSHALFQLTGALRNVAGEEEMFPQFVSTGAVIELCKAMELFSSDLDVISNISRTLSIISTHDDCCTAIVDYENSFKLFVKLFQKYPGRQDIIVRLGYALGNLMASSDTARTKFFNEEGAVASMLNLLAIYLDKDLHMLGSSESHNELAHSDAGSSGSVEDVIVKMIRILANMSINPMVGSSLACSTSTFYNNNNNVHAIEIEHKDMLETKENNKDGGQFLDVLLTVLRRKSVTESEELVHSVLSTLNNLSYYPTSNDGTFGERQLEIAEALCSLLNTDNKDCLVEATRVYGNLTRSKDTRDFLLESGAWTKILKFLEWDDPELLCTTVGILVNMMADWDKRVALKEGHGIERLTKVLNKFGEGDWQLATLICQALWNYCIESTNLHAALGIEETNRLLGILVDFLDEERLFGVVEGTEINEALATSEHYQMWEEFAGVATNLLEKMETFLDSLDSLEPLETLELASEQQSLGHHLVFAHPESEYQVL